MTAKLDQFVHKLHTLKSQGSTQLTVDIDHLLGLLSDTSRTAPAITSAAFRLDSVRLDGGSFD